MTAAGFDPTTLRFKEPVLSQTAILTAGTLMFGYCIKKVGRNNNLFPNKTGQIPC